MRDHSSHVELDRWTAVKTILENVDFKPKAQMVPLNQSFGRVLASDVSSNTDVPTVRTCALDSIAVHFADFADGAIPDTSQWVRGVDWEFANTGIAMPEGFDTAIVIEHVEVSDDAQHVKVLAAPRELHGGTKPAGANMKRGDVIATAGTLVTPAVAAAIGTGNVSHVPVVAAPKVAFMATGNELVMAGSPYRGDGRDAVLGKTVETNGLLVQGKVEDWGGEYMPMGITPDDPEVIAKRIKQACAMADIVVLNAGSSKGSDDWSVEEMEELGQVFFHETNHGPGHHSSFAVVDNTPVVGISGPPSGASFTLDFYVKPLINAWLGIPTEPATVKARLMEEFPKKARAGKKTNEDGSPISGETRPTVVREGVAFYGVKPVRVKLNDEGVMEAWPLKGHFNSPSARDANALFMLPSEAELHPVVGQVIEVELR